MEFRIGADGLVPIGNVSSNYCCPDLCVDICGLICSTVNLLPTGPLWDGPKTETIGRFLNNDGTNPCEYACTPDDLSCQSIVSYAVYSARLLLDNINGALYPSLRESDPNTAVETLDSWIERLGWENCYKSICRSPLLGDLTDFEIIGECGPQYCDIELPPDLELAVKRGIVKSLARVNMGIIKNTSSINWVIEPLGAKIGIRNPNEICEEDFKETPDCCDLEFEIMNSVEEFEAVDTNPSMDCNKPKPGTIKAYYDVCLDKLPAGGKSRIWPGVIAAECIVRSLLPQSCPNKLFRGC